MKDEAGTRQTSSQDSAEPRMPDPEFLSRLTVQIKDWGSQLGFQKLGICDTDLESHEERLSTWLREGFHGEMSYMERHGTRRSRPGELVPGTVRVISARMNYLKSETHDALALMDDPEKALVSRYALGRDYHKIIRKRLQQLATRIQSLTGPFGYRAFTDSAPVLEKALAQKAGLGWIGKHTNLINEQAGSWFFLGELYTNLRLEIDSPSENHCGNCHACIDACPTRAIIAPYKLDARLCISYLTIELRGAIPEQLRPLIGNRVYGCDDCQLVCPWNRFSGPSSETDFNTRHGLDSLSLIHI